MNQEELPQDGTEDENAPKTPTPDAREAYVSVLERLMGPIEIVPINHTTHKEGPSQERETRPSHLESMRKDRESQRIPDLQPRPRPKAGDPYDVFPANKNPRVPQSNKEKLSDTEKRPTEAERRIAERHKYEIAKIETRRERTSRQKSHTLLDPPDDPKN